MNHLLHTGANLEIPLTVHDVGEDRNRKDNQGKTPDNRSLHYLM
jgi:hypothetical protein